MHAHVPGWRLCDLCGIQMPMNCPTCVATHVRLHHTNRRLRRAEKMKARKR